MKKLFLFILAVSLVLTFAMPVIAEESQCLLIENHGSNPFLTLENSGCCSWHDGVCGCTSSGRAICCDGTISRSCGC